jgi:hypothetical protein
MRGLGLSLLVLLCACDGPSPEVTVLAHKKPYADLDLKKATASLTQTSTTTWTLQKIGSKGASTITWQATATEGATQSGLLIVNGTFKLKNKGQGGATIGNIVVNLQTKINGRWITRVSDVADATQDDAATEAYVDSDRCSENKKKFKESAASGHLLFTDDATNSAFALVPQVTIDPDTTKKLRFSASFDNNVLHLPAGTRARVEIIVSFGNAKPGRSSAHDVDINGNGIIDDDEHWIESVDQEKELKVPPEIPSNVDVVLSDSASDITTTGTVTFSNPVININGTQALVTVNYDGGATGGTITNCAHLTGDGQTVTVEDDDFPNVQGIDLTACNTQVIGPHTCTPGTVGCGWKNGEVITHIQDDWGDASTSAGVLLGDRFNTVYGGQGYVEVGIPGSGGFSMLFTNAGAVFTYQPASGPPAALSADLVDPTSTASGIYGGQVLALRFNIDLADAGYLEGTSGQHVGNLTLCGLAQTGLNGMTVRSFIDVANTALGGGPTAYSIDDLAQIAGDVNAAFNNGNPSLFAEEHLFNGPCPP